MQGVGPDPAIVPGPQGESLAVAIEGSLQLALLPEGLAQAVERLGLVPAVARLPRERQGDGVLVGRRLRLAERQEAGAQLVAGDRFPAAVPGARKGGSRLTVQAGCLLPLATIGVLLGDALESLGLKGDLAQLPPGRERQRPALHRLDRLLGPEVFCPGEEPVGVGGAPVGRRSRAQRLDGCRVTAGVAVGEPADDQRVDAFRVADRQYQLRAAIFDRPVGLQNHRAGRGLESDRGIDPLLVHHQAEQIALLEREPVAVDLSGGERRRHRCAAGAQRAGRPWQVHGRPAIRSPAGDETQRHETGERAHQGGSRGRGRVPLALGSRERAATCHRR